MGAKYVTLNAFFSMATVDRSNQFSSLTLTTEREHIDASVFGDRAVRYEKGIFTNGIGAMLRPDADFVFQNILMGYYAADTAIACVLRLKNAAKSATNPEMTFNVHVTKAPLSAERGKLFEQQMDWPIDGPITYDYTTSTITLG